MGDLEINIYEYNEGMEFIHNAISPSQDYMVHSCKSLVIDGDSVHWNEMELENILSGSSSHLNEFYHELMALQGIENQCVFLDDNVIQALTRMDNTHIAIEDLIGKIQMEERQKGLQSRISHLQLQHIKEAIEIIKDDYVH